MNMFRLFQERLDVSRGNAIWRVIGFISLSSCFAAIIFVVSATISLFTYSFKEEIPLLSLSSEHIQAEFLNGDVSVDKEKFTRLMKNGEGKFSNKTFICLNGESIVYMTNFAGLKYLYEQRVPVSHNLIRDYSIRSQRIQDGFVVREIEWNKHGLIILLLLESLLLAFVFESALFIQRKSVSVSEKDIKVWF